MQAEQVPAVVVGQRERDARGSVLGLEPALVIDAPQRIRASFGYFDSLWTRHTSACHTGLGQTGALDNLTDGARGRHGQIRPVPLEPRHQLLRPPRRVLEAQMTDAQLDSVRGRVWMMVPRPTPIVEAGRTLRHETVQPLVASLSADSVPRAQRRHRLVLPYALLHELKSFRHRARLHPRHGASMP